MWGQTWMPRSRCKTKSIQSETCVFPRAHRALPDGLQAALHGYEGRWTPMTLTETQQVFAAGWPHLQWPGPQQRGASSAMRCCKANISS